MNISFSHIKIHNFCGLRDLDIELFDRTIIKGVNASGKSTIKNAIYWVLFDKLADGSQATGIRPHDENGDDINLIDIEVELTMNCDGKEIIVKKTQKQNWVKDRTTQEQIFKGNVNEYEINGIPKKQKDYFEYMNQYIDSDVFVFCTNPQSFLKMDTKNRRAKLFGLVGDADEQVIASNPQFESIANDLTDGTIEELVARSQKAIKELKKNLELIPARIDEKSRELVDDHTDELLESKKIFENKRNAEETAIANLETVSETYREVNQRILEQERQLTKMVYDADNANKDAVQSANSNVQNLIRDIAVENARLKSCDAHIENVEKVIDTLRGEWESANEQKFDESDLHCPVCGAEYSADRIDELKEEFENKKTSNKNSIETRAKSFELELNRYKSEKEEILNKIDEMTEELKTAEEKVENVIKVDITTSCEYKKLSKSIEKLKKELETLNPNSAEKGEHLNNIRIINESIKAIDIELSKIENNKVVKARMADLEQEQISVSQKIAEQEQILDLLKEFSRCRVEIVTEQINAFFKVIKWQMFKQQINGDYAEVCIPIVVTDNSNATSYDGLLNHGNKILADIDICNAFQLANGVNCPIMIDDTESVDEWRIPNTPNQLICFRRTDDKKLTVERMN